MYHSSHLTSEANDVAVNGVDPTTGRPPNKFLTRRTPWKYSSRGHTHGCLPGHNGGQVLGRPVDRTFVVKVPTRRSQVFQWSSPTPWERRLPPTGSNMEVFGGTSPGPGRDHRDSSSGRGKPQGTTDVRKHTYDSFVNRGPTPTVLREDPFTFIL